MGGPEHRSLLLSCAFLASGKECSWSLHGYDCSRPVQRTSPITAYIGLGSNVGDRSAHLNDAVRFEDRNPETWNYLAIAYGRDKNMGMMALASAEQGIASGDLDFARQQAARAIKLLPPGPAKQRAVDLQGEAKLRASR